MNTEYDTSYVSCNPPPAFDPLNPELAVAMTLHRTLDANAHTFDHPNVIAARLREFTKAVEEGDLSHVRRILASQMVMLERLFHHLMARTSHFEYSYKDYERVARLATRAQIQMARTAAILQQMTNAAMKAKKQEAAKTVIKQNERTEHSAVPAKTPRFENERRECVPQG